MSKELKKEDLIINHVYSGKRERLCGFYGHINDRMLIRVWEDTVQYDSPSIKTGGKYPIITIDEFLKWAKYDVTELCPKDSWRTGK